VNANFGSVTVRNNQVSGATVGIGSNADLGVFIVGNQIDNCKVGIHSGKYQNNLTYCEIPFEYGTLSLLPNIGSLPLASLPVKLPMVATPIRLTTFTSPCVRRGMIHGLMVR